MGMLFEEWERPEGWCLRLQNAILLSTVRELCMTANLSTRRHRIHSALCHASRAQLGSPPVR